MSVEVETKEQIVQQDIKRLHGLGYAQELFREMGGFSNFAISFTIISILTGAISTYGFAIGAAGPLAAIIGWPLVSIFVIFVGLAMAELASAFPTAGGLYYWASKLRGPGWGWYTGWFNLIGQVAVTASIDFGLALLVDIWLSPKLSFLQAAISNPNVVYIARWNLLTYAVILALHCILNVYGIRLVAILNDISVWWHIGGVLLVVGALFFFAPHHSNAFGFLFTGSANIGADPFKFPVWYGFLLGLLLAQYTLTGYDASAHVTEETVGAARRAPWGIIMSIVISAIAGLVLLVGLTIAIPDIDPATKASGLATVGTLGIGAVPYILTTRLGSDTAFVIFGLILVAQFFCGMSSVTANSRMIYAFSRDGAVPGSSLWHSLNRRRIPANAVWLAGGAAFVLGIPVLWNSVVFLAVVSISVVAIYIAYVLPTFTRLLNPNFTAGPWNLGRWSKPIGWVAVAWVVFITVLFVLPQATPVTRDSFNYAGVVVFGAILLLTIWWLVSVRHWFKGPIVQGDEATLEKIEAEINEESIYKEPSVTA
ncbi:MAG: amino acid permease [Ktedonobacterales bacterium]